MVKDMPSTSAYNTQYLLQVELSTGWPLFSFVSWPKKPNALLNNAVATQLLKTAKTYCPEVGTKQKWEEGRDRREGGWRVPRSKLKDRQGLYAF